MSGESLSVLHCAPSVSREDGARFEAYVRTAHEAFQVVREQNAIREYATTVVLTDEFAADVQRYHSPAVPTDFRPEKVGGIAAKNLWQKADFSEVVIVFEAKQWRERHDEPEYRVGELSFIAHELAHPLIERARWAAGIHDDLNALGSNPTAASAGFAYGLIGEYLADVFAHIFVSSAASRVENGIKRGATKWDVSGPWILDDLEAILRRAHEVWPQMVQDYREWRIPLEDLWTRLSADVFDTLKVAMHRQLAADLAGRGRLLDEEPFKSLPATRLYLRGTWDGFFTALRAQPILPGDDPAAWRSAQAELAKVGSAALFEIWRRLGIDIAAESGKALRLNVRAPIR